MSATGAETVLDVTDLTVRGPGGKVLVDHVSFSIASGEVFGLVGESGSGKTLTALAVMQLLPPGLVPEGSVRLHGNELLGLSERDMGEVRGREASMIFQEPVTALNPTFSVGSQLVAAVRAHASVSRRAARVRAIELLDQVGIPDPARRLSFYPHQMSGGMCQRVMIAAALAGNPRLLIADEPTTSLDVTIQEEIVRLLERLARDTGIAVLFISHDLGLVGRLCHRVAVAYAGQLVEMDTAREILLTPRHPYTQGLIRCVPDLDHIGVLRRGIPGSPPLAGTWPQGCRFRPRCPGATLGCEEPQHLTTMGDGHEVRCWRGSAGAQAAEEAAHA
jgi:peptide/nickel transport system ATP-binding protein